MSFLVEVNKVSSIDCFVVVKLGITNFSEFVSIEISADVLCGAIKPLLCIPVLWHAVDFFF